MGNYVLEQDEIKNEKVKVQTGQVQQKNKVLQTKIKEVNRQEGEVELKLASNLNEVAYLKGFPTMEHDGRKNLSLVH